MESFWSPSSYFVFVLSASLPIQKWVSVYVGQCQVACSGAIGRIRFVNNFK
uniref:Uncharacterized protein n=1 Tax=Physcomitrium patens TaxID=3218 RepID=A0A2K1J7G4_PHYPA|nr:hypothetical protein PHYPA_020579 [Physcomitrium patens]